MFNDYDLIKSIGTQSRLKTNAQGRIKKQKREPESAEQKALIEWAGYTVIHGLRIGDYLTHVPNEGKRGPKAIKDFIELGGSPGYPDLMLDIPTSKYHGLRIEMKAPKPNKSVVSNNQNQWLHRLDDIGYQAVICYSASEAIVIITEYMRRYEQSN
ncbi:VRR-NUC domain-containing protein [Photobacterium kishitanii]|uniref:VRR-NUC domain-containing protein n=1 Tax=Photobacterium kishitanii TaxID=318456 RepID=UPI000D155DD9|nr:VRR-NUC domain-containing protein [Photobacterium kishitanii]PSU23829.1 VRR-NUC domain-containing protein [Photobacterium kishitanii]